MIETEADRQLLLKTLGDRVNIIGTNGGEKEVYAIYDQASYNMEVGSYVGVSTNSPTLTVSTKDFIDFDQHDIVVINSVEFIIVDLQADGTGMTTLNVRRAQ